MLLGEFGLAPSAAPPALPGARHAVLEDWPLFVVDRRLAIEAMNEAGARLLEDGALLVRSGDRIDAADEAASLTLQDAVEAAFTFGRASTVCLDHVAKDCGVAVEPLIGPGKRLALLRVCDPERKLDAVLERAARTYQLTRAEMLLAKALMRGVSASDFAAERGIKISTVRTQLASLYAKTGVCGNIQLMSHLLLQAC